MPTRRTSRLASAPHGAHAQETSILRAGVGRFYVQDIGNIFFDKNRNLKGRLTVQSTATNLISTWKDPFNFGAANSCNTPAGMVCVERPLVLTGKIDRKTPYVDQ